MTPSPQTRPASTREQRIRAVVERFGPVAAGSPTAKEAVYLKELQVAATGRPIQAGDVWVERDAGWQEAGVQPGDTVIFTTQVQKLVQEVKDPDAADAQSRPRLITTTLLAPSTTEVAVVRRPVAARQQPPIAQPVPTPASVPAPAPLAHPGPMPRRRRPMLAVAAAALLLGTLGGGALGWWAGTRQAPAPSATAAP
jgi:hypothetical protein